MFKSHRLGLGEVLVAFWHVKAIDPCLVSRKSFFRSISSLVIEEQDIGSDTGIR
jgi:hypothetical protein